MKALLITLLLTAVPGVASGSASASAAAAETCQGKPVTISDPDGGTVEGTDGDDVILASGPGIAISAKGGNDTICAAEGYVAAGDGRDAVYVGGEAETEAIDIRDAEDLDITLGEGGGVVQLVNVRRGVGSVDASDGGYLVLIGKNSVEVDLEDDAMALDGGTYGLVGNPGVFSVARRVELVGDAAANRLRINQYACRSTIKGGKGDDDLEIAGSDGDLPFPENCGKRTPRVFGQRGDDTLTGRRYDDTLVGGPGQDEAFGGFGSDTCRAEVEKNCDR